MERLKADFYRRGALNVAPELLGKWLCKQTEDGIMRVQITETEAYVGEDDSACHASRGRTPRNEVMYSAGGVAYVYLCYGIHHLLNIVTGEKEFPEGVMIRAVEGANGPGKLTRMLGICRELNREDVVQSQVLWIEDDGGVYGYSTAPRVGIDYARPEDRDRLWRFILQRDVPMCCVKK